MSPPPSRFWERRLPNVHRPSSQMSISARPVTAGDMVPTLRPALTLPIGDATAPKRPTSVVIHAPSLPMRPSVRSVRASPPKPKQGDFDRTCGACCCWLAAR
ncbi:hypothetical protein BDW22DRAFT_1153889 [Trametopsis cervina]|nr:hypothetical protein BDW22DRAFT_1153889 [Trametopsis cervina]